MSIPDQTDSDQPSEQPEVAQPRIPKVVVQKSVVQGTANPQQKPVVVRARQSTSQRTVRVNRRDTPHISTTKSKSPVRQQHPRTTVSSAPRHGRPDFSSSIITEPSQLTARKNTAPSIQQRVFFDAAIAVVSLSFMVLTLLHL